MDQMVFRTQIHANVSGFHHTMEFDWCQDVDPEHEYDIGQVSDYVG